jgi:hypothetical protein
LRLDVYQPFFKFIPEISDLVRNFGIMGRFLFLSVFLTAMYSQRISAQHSPEELEFIKEVNLLRSEPARYALHVQTFLQSDTQMRYYKEYRCIADTEVLPLLANLKPLQPLIADDILRQKLNHHSGVDSAHRMIQHARGWLDSRYGMACENLIASKQNDYRNMVIKLLLDREYTGRYHRHNLLREDATHTAVRRLVLGDTSNLLTYRIWWIQEFVSYESP